MCSNGNCKRCNPGWGGTYDCQLSISMPQPNKEPWRNVRKTEDKILEQNGKKLESFIKSHCVPREAYDKLQDLLELQTKLRLEDVDKLVGAEDKLESARTIAEDTHRELQCLQEKLERVMKWVSIEERVSNHDKEDVIFTLGMNKSKEIIKAILTNPQEGK